MLKRVTQRKWKRNGLEWPDQVDPDTQLFLPRPPRSMGRFGSPSAGGQTRPRRRLISKSLGW